MPTPSPDGDDDNDDGADPLSVHHGVTTAHAKHPTREQTPVPSPTLEHTHHLGTPSPTRNDRSPSPSPTADPDKPVAIIRFGVVYKGATSKQFIPVWRESFATITGVQIKDIHLLNEKCEHLRCSFDQTIFLTRSFCSHHGDGFCVLADWNNPMIKQIQGIGFKRKLEHLMRAKGAAVTSNALSIAVPYTTKVEKRLKSARHQSAEMPLASSDQRAGYTQKEPKKVLGPLVAGLACLLTLIGAMALRTSASAVIEEQNDGVDEGISTYKYGHACADEEKISLVTSTKAEEDI
jgi:hypothetical protein